MPNHYLRAFCAAAVVVLSGCQTISESLEAPDVRLSNVRLQELSSLQQQFVLDFEVSNPNAIPLPIKAINYGVMLGGMSLVNGRSESAFRVPANGEGSFSISVETSLMEVVKALGTRIMLGGEQSLDYQVGGDVAVDLPFIRPLPFKTEGTVQITR